MPAYLVSRYAAQYRVIVDVLMAEQDTSLTGLSFDEVTAGVREYLAARLPADVTGNLLAEESFHLDSRLQSLEKWQVVTRWQEPARTGEDFLRRRDRYQLTDVRAQEAIDSRNSWVSGSVEKTQTPRIPRVSRTL